MIILYEYTYVYSIFMSTSERLNQFNLEIHKVDHQKRLTIDGMSPSTKK
jgi:hypothetical protein